jgi:hypothetical protein
MQTSIGNSDFILALSRAQYEQLLLCAQYIKLPD